MVGAATAGAGGASQGLDSIPFPGIAQRLKDGNVVPFLGAGASSSGVPESELRLPCGPKLVEELVNGMEPYPGEGNDALTKVSQFWVECRFGRRDLYELLRKRFYTDQQGADLNVTAQLLAEIEGIPCIVTTNYDDHIEQAFRKRDRDFVVLTHETDPGRVAYVHVAPSVGKPETLLSTAFRLTNYTNRTVIYKMHGTLTPPPEDNVDTVVITEDDYISFLAQTANLPPEALVRHFAKSRFLFLGYSLEDWNFRVVLRRLTDEGHVYKHWAVQKDPSRIEEFFWFGRGVLVYNARLEDFVERIREALQ